VEEAPSSSSLFATGRGPEGLLSEVNPRVCFRKAVYWLTPFGYELMVACERILVMKAAGSHDREVGTSP